MLSDKLFDLTVNPPIGAAPFFDLMAQKIVAMGVLVALVLWGIAAIVKGRK